LETGRELGLQRGAGDHDPPGLQRLPENLQHLAVELWKLVQEQHAVVRQ